MLEVEVDVAGAEALERRVDRPADVLGGSVEHPARTRRALEIDPDPELGRDHVLVAPPRDRLADELLVRVRPVDLGRIEEVDPELEPAADRGDRLGLVGGAVEGRHAHAAQAERGDA